MSPSQGGGRGFDRSYKRGAVMGLTVAEAFILLSFCLLLLFTWWQIDTERRSLIAADRIGELTKTQKEEIVSALSDGTFDLAKALREAGVDTTTPDSAQEIAEYSRFMREEDLKRLMDSVVKLSPETRLAIETAVEVSNEAAFRSALQDFSTGSSTVDTIADRLAVAAQQQTDIVGLLEESLGETIRSAGGSIDSRGTITLPEAFLFDAGENQIKDPDALIAFCSTWVETLRNSELDLSELKIEGHASSEGKPGQTQERAYLYNLNLSQLRAQNALGLCLSGLADPATHQWAQQYLSSIGYSSSRLIYRADGSEDRVASRRVMFSVALDQDRLIEDITRDVAVESADAVVLAATGPARVVDGDTLDIDGTSFRISGIDAPEMGQLCLSPEGTEFDCGEVARRGLEQMINGQEVACSAEEVDFYRRPIAVCTLEGIDLGGAMVSQGYALAYAEYSDSYVVQAEAAKAASIGIWSTTFEAPWDYRNSN